MSSFDKSVGIILINKEGKILLVHRDNKIGIRWPDKWAVPGGGVEEGEEPKEACLRETLEEIGCELKDPKLFVNDQWTGEDGFVRDRYVFWERYDESQPINCYEGQEARFVSENEYKRLETVPTQQEFMLKAFRELK